MHYHPVKSASSSLRTNQEDGKLSWNTWKSTIQTVHSPNATIDPTVHLLTHFCASRLTSSGDMLSGMSSPEPWWWRWKENEWARKSDAYIYIKGITIKFPVKLLTEPIHSYIAIVMVSAQVSLQAWQQQHIHRAPRSKLKTYHRYLKRTDSQVKHLDDHHHSCDSDVVFYTNKVHAPPTTTAVQNIQPETCVSLKCHRACLFVRIIGVKHRLRVNEWFQRLESTIDYCWATRDSE